MAQNERRTNMLKNKDYELEKIYHIVVGSAPTYTNPRYKLYVEKEHIAKDAIIKEIQKYNPKFSEYDYEDKIFCKISDAMDEYALDAFAKGIEFERNLHNQTEKHANKNYNL